MILLIVMVISLTSCESDEQQKLRNLWNEYQCDRGGVAILETHEHKVARKVRYNLTDAEFQRAEICCDIIDRKGYGWIDRSDELNELLLEKRKK